MRSDAPSRADELQFGFAGDPIGEGLLRAEEEIAENRLPDAQRWISAVFELVRRNRRASH
ncbi:MAG: hypothetical protein JWO65_1516 [Sphingomonas bacterium]|jgi:hypothetical protein|nr:hypothetical protein [Sphingomonas bacterium]